MSSLLSSGFEKFETLYLDSRFEEVSFDEMTTLMQITDANRQKQTTGTESRRGLILYEIQKTSRWLVDLSSMSWWHLLVTSKIAANFNTCCLAAPLAPLKMG